MDTSQIISQRIKNIRQLRALRDLVDPASGMSVMVRRGVLRDRDEDDQERRAWVELEICDHMDGILELLIDAQTRSLDLFIKSAGREIAGLNQAVREAKDFLSS